MAKTSTRTIASKGANKPKSTSKAASPPVTRVSVSNGNGSERSVSVRKIENGYVISESTYGPKGDYKCTERFSATAPKIDVAAVAKGRK